MLVLSPRSDSRAKTWLLSTFRGSISKNVEAWITFFAKYLMLFTVLSSADTFCQFTVLIINQMIFDSTLDCSFRLFPHQVAQIGFLALFNNFVCVCEAVCCDKTAIYSALVFLSWLLEEKTKCEGLFTDCGMSPVCCIVSSTVYQEMSNASL